MNMKLGWCYDARNERRHERNGEENKEEKRVVLS